MQHYDRTLVVDHCTFDKHYSAIDINYGSNHTLTNNTFTSASSDVYPPMQCTERTKFIALSNAYNSVIYSNTLNYTKIAPSCSTYVPGAYLMHIDETGSSNTLIYSNYFTTPGGRSDSYGLEMYGINFTGGNTGVIVQCNTFHDIKTDIYVDGLINNMGTSSVAAGNEFSLYPSSLEGNVCNNNGVLAFSYYYSTGGVNRQPVQKGIPGAVLVPTTTANECPGLNCHSWPVAINEPKLNSNSLTIYPNPANTILNLDFFGQKATGFNIYDQTGKMVFSVSNIKNTQQIDISAWPAGIYFIQPNAMEKGVKFIVAH